MLLPSHTLLLHACAKINLCLEITGIRKDGYHLLRSVMQSVSLFDEVSVSLDRPGEIRILCDDGRVPAGGENAAAKAASAFFSAAELRCGANIRITKRIPLQAGLAGGSADAAAVLTALNLLTGLGLSAKQLCLIGAGIGADVPFCLTGGTALCEGIGERINPLEDMPDCSIVLCKPQTGTGTKEAFVAFDRSGAGSVPSCGQVMEALRGGDCIRLGESLYNDFEPALNLPEYAAIRNLMSRFSPLGVSLSGSGSTMFALFEQAEAAAACAEYLRRSYTEVFTVRPERSGVQIL